MSRLIYFISILFYIFSVNVAAETTSSTQVDISEIENQERQQIIKELSWRLNTKKVCGLTLTWDDRGSGADKDGYFFIPPAIDGQYMLGGYGAGKLVSDYHCVLMVSQAADNPKGTPPLLVAPADWKMIWKDSGSGAHKDGSMWQAVAPDKNYRCLGGVPVVGYNKPNLPNYRCVHASVTRKIKVDSLLWSDKGSGAEQQVSIFRLPQTISMIAVAGRTKQVEAYDLTPDASSKPDPKKVEAILQERLALLKAEIEEQARVMLAQKEQEQKKRAEELAKQQQAELEKIKEKALAEKSQAKAVAISNEEKRLAEEKKEAEKAAAKAAAEKKRLAEEEKQVKEETVEETKAVIEEPVEMTKPEQVEEVVSSPEPVSEESEARVSKGINDLILYFVKYIAILIGGIILLVIIFKVLFGSKKSADK